MNVLSRIPLWLRLGDSRPPQEIEADIREELEAHLAMLAEENQRCGMNPDEAYEQAQARFGDAEQYVAECTHIHTGDRIMLQRILLGMVALLIAAVASLGWQASQLSRGQQQTQALLEANVAQMEQIRKQLEGTPEAAAARPGTVDATSMGKIVGEVVDRSGNAIAGADVLVILKTWPGGRFQMRSRATKTNQQGQFRFDEATPLNHKHSLLVTVVKDGFRLNSTYLTEPYYNKLREFRMRFVTSPAIPMNLTIVNEIGEPIPAAKLYVSGLKSSSGDEDLVYHYGSEPIWKTADENGSAKMTYGNAGDTLEVAYRPPDSSEWYSRKILIAEEGGNFQLPVDGDPSDDSSEEVLR